jgi:hypothetical protein
MTQQAPSTSTPQFTQLASATSYVALGFQLVPIPYGTKGPNRADWNVDENLVKTHDAVTREFGGRPMNMGIQHKASGTVAIDIDDVETTKKIFDHFGIDYDGMVDKGMRIYSKQNRDKLIFMAPPGLELEQVRWPKRMQTRPNDVFTIFELRGGPNQDVLPPSRHPEGHFYVWQERRAPWDYDDDCMPTLPEDVLAFWKAYSDPQTGVREDLAELCPWAKKDARLPAPAPRAPGPHNDLIGKFNQANDVGEMLESCGYKRKGARYLAPSSSTAMAGVKILEDGRCYSHHGSDVLADGHAHDAFDILVLCRNNGNMQAALDEAARELGVDRRPAPVDVLSDADIARLMAESNARRVAAAAPAQVAAPEQAVEEDPPGDTPTADPIYPEHLKRPPGMVGVITDWILETSADPLPMIAVAGALSVVGVALARKVMTERKARTNFYLIGLARSGFGKDHARKCAKAIIEGAALQAECMGGEELVSGAGLRTAVAKRPGCSFLVDELGALLAAINHKNASPHMMGIIDTLMKMFSSTDSTMYGAEYADQKIRERVDIPYPCAGVYGTTVPSNFYSNLDSKAVSSGFLNRLLIIEESSRRPVNRPERCIRDVPKHITEWFRSAFHIIPQTDEEKKTWVPGMYPLVVDYTPKAKQIIHDFTAWVHDRADAMHGTPKEPLGEIWARAAEHATKIALAVGVGMTMDPEALVNARDKPCLSIDEVAAQWAVDFVRAITMHIELAASTRMGDSEHERLAQAVLAAIKRAGARGRLESELAKFCGPYKAAHGTLRDQITDMLKRNGQISLVQRGKGANGKGGMAWVAAEAAE